VAAVNACRSSAMIDAHMGPLARVRALHPLQVSRGASVTFRIVAMSLEQCEICDEPVCTKRLAAFAAKER